MSSACSGESAGTRASSFSHSVRAVDTPSQRERILDGPPCCIIASSGMLTGGPSAYYASRLVERADAAIVVTGYQDEEAPGRKLLDLAAILDRIGRGAGSAELSGDPRLACIRQALEVLHDESGGRAERIQQIFSLDYDPGWERPQPR